jgi:hypothetical protein
VNLQRHDEAIPPMWSYNTNMKLQHHRETTTMRSNSTAKQQHKIGAPQYNNNGKQQHQHNTVAPMHEVANQCKATK